MQKNQYKSDCVVYHEASTKGADEEGQKKGGQAAYLALLPAASQVALTSKHHVLPALYCFVHCLHLTCILRGERRHNC